MYVRIPKYVWIVAVIIGLAMGIWPGVGLGQRNWNWLGVVLGWLYVPMLLSEIIQGIVHWSDQFTPAVLTFCGYPFAVIGYAVCAYLTLKSVRRAGIGLLVTLAAVVCSAVSSIPAAIITMSINQGIPLGSFAAGYLSALPIHGIIALHLGVSAVLGWLLARGVLGIGRMVGRAGRENVSRETLPAE